MNRPSMLPRCVVLFSLFLLQSCAGVQDVASSPDYSRTRGGAGIGAAAGAVIGLLTHGN